MKFINFLKQRKKFEKWVPLCPLYRESFEFLLKPGKSSFLRKQESIVFDNFLDSGFHRNDVFGRNSKLS